MNLSDLVHRTTKGNESMDSDTRRDLCPLPETAVTTGFFNVSSTSPHYPMEEYSTPIYHSAPVDRLETNANDGQQMDNPQWQQSLPSYDQKLISSTSFHSAPRQSPSSPNLASSSMILPLHANTTVPIATFPTDSGSTTGLPSPRTHQASPSPRKSVSLSPDLQKKPHIPMNPSTHAAGMAPSIHEPSSSSGLRYDRPLPTINGDNVTSETIEDGYIQYVTYRFPTLFSEDIECHSAARQKFSSFPKTGELSYDTWKLYTLVKKLDREEIKNWSQLVGELGLNELSGSGPSHGRPQFAGRLKRWMKNHKISNYFDYLLGNEDITNATDENYSGCLQKRNYQKRKPNKDAKGDKKSTKKRRPSLSNGEDSANTDEEEDEAAGPSNNHPLIAPAGSRKRMRDSSRAAVAVSMAEGGHPIPESERMDEASDDELNHDTNNEEEEEEEDDGGGLAQPLTLQAEVTTETAESADSEEEDELASTSSASGSPILNPASGPIPNELYQADVTDHSKPAAGPSGRANVTSCSRCERMEQTVQSMQSEMKQFKERILTLEKRIKSNEKDQGQVFQQIASDRKSTKQWRKNIAELLSRGPSDDNADHSK